MSERVTSVSEPVSAEAPFCRRLIGTPRSMIDVIECSSSRQPSRSATGRQALDLIGQALGDEPFVGCSILDDDRVHAVACGPPLVLIVEPVGHRRQGLTGIEAGRHVIDEALDERGDREDLLERRQSVADSDLDGAPVWGGADVPADLVDVVDDSGREHVVDVLLVVGPLIELGKAAPPSAAVGTSSLGSKRTRCPCRPRTGRRRTVPADAGRRRAER